jgi:hypothetical protein
MPLTEKQTFKLGFLRKCAEDGLTTDETIQRVKLAIQQIKCKNEKQAFWGGALAAGGMVGSKLLGMVPGLASMAGTAAVVAPVAAGAGAGYLAAKATNSDKSIVEDAKQDEVIGEYARLAEEARRRTRLKQLQQATGQRVIALTPGEQAD